MKTATIAAVALAGLMTSGAADAQTTHLEKSDDNWKVDCRDDGETNRCGLVYALVNRKTKNVVFSWTVVPKEGGSKANKVVLRTPNGVALADGVSIAFPGADPLRIAYVTCVSRGCLAEFDLTEQWIKALSSQANLTVSYKSVRGTPLQHEVKLDRFEEAFGSYLSQVKGN